MPQRVYKYITSVFSAIYQPCLKKMQTQSPVGKNKLVWKNLCNKRLNMDIKWINILESFNASGYIHVLLL